MDTTRQQRIEALRWAADKSQREAGMWMDAAMHFGEGNLKNAKKAADRAALLNSMANELEGAEADAAHS